VRSLNTKPYHSLWSFNVWKEKIPSRKWDESIRRTHKKVWPKHFRAVLLGDFLNTIVIKNDRCRRCKRIDELWELSRSDSMINNPVSKLTSYVICQDPKRES